jgi:rare lipoprotein A (peptidoglycan hydrolase)
MRPIQTRVRRATALVGSLGLIIPLAVSPATAQSDSQGTSSTTTPPGAQTATPAASAPTARAAVSIRSTRRNVISGRRALVRGLLRPAAAGKTVRLQVRRHGHWITVARDRTNGRGVFRLRFTPHRPGSMKLRVRSGHARKSAGRLNVFRRVFVSWYGPGFYGGRTACGGTLGYGTLGVAHKTLPCGTKVTLRYHGRSVRVPVIDRGPYVGGREYDLTGATKRALGFGSTGTVLSTH